MSGRTGRSWGCSRACSHHVESPSASWPGIARQRVRPSAGPMINSDGRKRPYVLATDALLRGAEDVGAGMTIERDCASTRPESALIVAAFVPIVALGGR